MASIEVENYWKSYGKIMDRWAEKVKKPLQEIQDISPEIAELEEKGNKRSEDEEKRYKQLVAQRKRCREAVDKADTEMRIELSLIQPPSKPSKDDYKELKGWIEGKIKKIKSGLPLGGGVSLKPDVDIDITKLKIKKVGVILEWQF
jgi:hypothetical protein